MVDKSFAIIPGCQSCLIRSYQPAVNSVFHQYTIRLKQRRDELKEYLLKKGIPSMIYYPVPMHRQKYMATEGDFGVSDQLSREVLSLPMHTELTAEQQNYICNNIESFFA